MSRNNTPLVFISHHNRDAAIAKAFDDLLTDLSGGTVRIFLASDRKGTHGIQHGEEWYPALIEKLIEATDVVALLTPSGINRPWVLYEMEVAKGRHPDQPVHGVALGCPNQPGCDQPLGAVPKLRR